MTLFKGKYRIESNRLQNWDYSGNGHYFVTIVTENRDCIFGEIENNVLIPSDFGIIADIEWLTSFKIRKELILDEYILMPNHLHAIIIIESASIVKPDGRLARLDSDRPARLDSDRPARLDSDRPARLDSDRLARLDSDHQSRLDSDHPSRLNSDRLTRLDSGHPDQLETGRPARLETGLDKTNPKLYRKPKSISSFIAGYKSSVITKIDDFIDQNNLDLAKYNKDNKLWQSNYHDHIIRNMEEYSRIKTYIQNNPMNWNKNKPN